MVVSLVATPIPQQGLVHPMHLVLALIQILHRHLEVILRWTLWFHGQRDRFISVWSATTTTTTTTTANYICVWVFQQFRICFGSSATGGGLFGSKPATSTFGGFWVHYCKCIFTFWSIYHKCFWWWRKFDPNVNNGTAGKALTPFTEKDSANMTNVFQNICCMPEYKNLLKN